MKILDEIIHQQKEYIEQCEFKTKKFIKSISLDNIEVILLSGSVSRGDFMPGKYGGMIDLTVMKTEDSILTASDVFGENENPDIPYHCIRHLGQWFQIAFNEFIDSTDFEMLDESNKYAILESKILHDSNNRFTTVLEKINTGLSMKLNLEKNNGIGYINYLISGYKKDRWISREAYPQLHSNLNTAIQVAIKCLFYNNGKYAPAEDRIFYYSFDLPKTTDNYEKIVTELFKQEIMSFEDYKRREEIFIKLFLPMLRM